MSADNGVYIAKFPEGYRVAYAMAIDNIGYSLSVEKPEKYLQVLKEYFGGSKIFNTKEEAILAGHKIADEMYNKGGYLEYGVQYIGEYPSFLKEG